MRRFFVYTFNGYLYILTIETGHICCYNYSEDLLFCIRELFKVDNKIAKLSNKKFAFFKNTRLKKLKAYKHKIRIGVLTFYYLWDNIYTSFDEAHAHAKKDVYIESDTSDLKLPNII